MRQHASAKKEKGATKKKKAHTSAYVSMRQACGSMCQQKKKKARPGEPNAPNASLSWRAHTLAYVRIRQHTSAKKEKSATWRA
jgi:hypothetical protein